MINLTIDGKAASVPEGTTILDAARTVGVTIPTLCYNKHLKPYGGCRVCLAEIGLPGGKGGTRLVSSCTFPVSEGLEVSTTSAAVIDRRRFVLQLLLVNSPDSPELRKLAADCGFDPDNDDGWDNVATYLFKRAPREKSRKCILCGQCVRVCNEVTERNALCFSARGSARTVRTPFKKIAESCIGCGSCSYVCPTGAVTVEEAE